MFALSESVSQIDFSFSSNDIRSCVNMAVKCLLEALEQEAACLGTRDRVTFAACLSSTALERALKEIRVIVMASQTEESAGLVARTDNVCRHCHRSRHWWIQGGCR